MEGIVRVGAESDCVLLIDPTADFYPEFDGHPRGAFPVTDAHMTVPPTNRLLRFNWAARVLGRDCHPADHYSFAEYPVHCVAGTPGAELHPAIIRGPFQERPYGWFDQVVDKGTQQDVDAYSAFFDRFGQPVADGQLEKFLGKKGIRRLFVAGNEAAHCVADTSLHGLRLKFEVFVIRNAVGSFTGRTGQSALAELEKAGARIISSFQLEAA